MVVVRMGVRGGGLAGAREANAGPKNGLTCIVGRAGVKPERHGATTRA